MNRALRSSLLLIPLILLVLGSCSGERKILFGAVLPLTGASQIYGVPIQNGVQLAFEEAKRRTDLKYNVELRVVDSQSDPKRAAELLEKLFDDGALAVIGGVKTDEALEMVPVIDRFDRVLLSPSASSPELTGISRNFLRVFPSDFLEGTKMGNFAAQTLGLKTAVILAAQSKYARGIQGIFKTEFERYGGKVLEVLEYPPGTSDFSGLTDRVMTLKPDAVYLADFAQEIARMITLLRGKGFKGTILTTSAFAAPDVIEQVGKDAEGVTLTQPVFDPTSDDPKVQDFVKAYKAKYGIAPDLYAAHGFDAMQVFVEGLVEGGWTPKDFLQGLRGIKSFPGVTGPLQFDERGDVQKYPRVYIISGGQLVDYEKAVEKRRQELLEKLHKLRNQSNGASGDGS
jgi:branched-chain amino acid transport system substrate-binding protein